jgi:hypothetical protein
LYVDIETGFAGDPYRRQFALDKFAIAAVKLSAGSASTLAPRSLRTAYLWRRELLRIKWLSEYHDPCLHNLRIRKPVVLDNYLQSPLYFSDCAQVLRLELLDGDVCTDDAEGIGGTDSVGVHARRNHGLTVAERGYYGAYSTAYYRACMDAILAERPAARFFLFGDDPDWIRDELLPFCPSGALVQTESDIQDFRLMTRCKHFIIANSTFSWWAAWLGMERGGIVCCGTTWNQGERRPPRNLIPPSWRRVSCQTPERLW